MVWSELTEGDEARKGYYMSKYMREIFQRRWYLVKDSKGEKRRSHVGNFFHVGRNFCIMFPHILDYVFKGFLSSKQDWELRKAFPFKLGRFMS